jgi:site-specific recombinase XerD
MNEPALTIQRRLAAIFCADFAAYHDDACAMQSICKGWPRLCKTASFNKLRPHDVRHNFTGQLQAAGASDSIIMSITGHNIHVMEL